MDPTSEPTAKNTKPDHAERPDEPEEPKKKRRTMASALLAGVLAVGGIAGLTQGMSSCSSTNEQTAKGPRPISAAEAAQLSQVRLHNWQDQKAGISGTVSEKTGKLLRFDGWIDWRRPLVYIRTAPRQGMGELLIQAVPGIVAIHAAQAGESSADGKPPAVPPAGNWRLRPMGLPLPKEPDPIDGLIGLLFALTADHADKADLLQQTDSQWLRQDSVYGTEVEVLLGPALMPKPSPSKPSPTAPQSPKPSSTPVDGRSLKAHGGAVAYWIDAGARLERLETYLSATVTAKVDIDRSQKAEFDAAPAFGGAAIAPRKTTAIEAQALAEMRRRTLAQGSGKLTITLPVAPAGMIQVNGWIDFREGVAYSLAKDLDDPSNDVLIHASHTRISMRKASGATAPPFPAPSGKWESDGWGELTQATELDLLLHETLSIGVDVRDNAKDLAKRSNRLRLDEIDGQEVAVFEIRGGGEPKGVPGSALFRYWVDPTGVVHRVEIRTRLGFAQLDIDYGKIPALPARV